MATNKSRNSLPEDMLGEILSRLAVKQLMLCKCVSKPWLKLISSPQFVKSHLHGVTMASLKKPTLLTVLKSALDDPPSNLSGSLVNFDSIVMPSCINCCKVICTSSYHGIVCVILVNGDIVLWNPSIRQCMKIEDSCKPSCLNPVVIEFTFDSVSSDYKVFRLLFSGKRERELSSVVVQVFSVETSDWSISTIVIPENFTIDELSRRSSTVIINMILYVYTWDEQLILFDLHKGVSQLIPFPVSVKRKCSGILDFEGSPGMVFESEGGFHFWRLGEVCSGEAPSWTKSFSIETDFELVIDYLGAGLFYGMQFRHGNIFPTSILYDHENKESKPFTGHFYEDRVRAELKYTESLVSLNGFSPCVDAPINQSRSKGYIA